MGPHASGRNRHRTERTTLADRKALGAAFALAAFFLFAFQDATVKWLVSTVPVWQVLFVRSVIIVAGCLAAGRRPLVQRAVSTPARWLLIKRATVTLIAWFCFFTAARSLPLGELVTLWFTAPIVVALLAAPILGERVGGIRWIAIGLGFLGAVFASDPRDMTFSSATILVLFGAACWGYGLVLTRLILRQETSLLQMLFNNGFFIAVTGIGCLTNWHVPDMTETILLIVVAAFGGFGQFCLFEATRHTPVAVIAPLEYTTLVWAFLIGFIIWGDVPLPRDLAGAALILAGGMTLVLAEQRARTTSTQPRPSDAK